MSQTNDLKDALFQSGFPIAGITFPFTPPHLSVYEAWLSAGRHAGMAYLASDPARAKRANPLHVFPTAKSLLVVGLPYSNPQTEYLPQAIKPVGRIAAYAWGSDYHTIIPSRLEAVLSTFFLTSQYRIYTDTGPILERDFAMQAGLGWIGKNTCLIHPQHGSYFLLGVAFLEAELTPDAPFPADRCGSCRRCMDACPTGCILPNRTIDANRCISYLTIENKGSIPPELRAQMGDWIFGCDACQTACPWNNRFARLAPDPQLYDQVYPPRPILTEELRLTPQEFNQKYRATPISRARRRGYLRNIAVALGNQSNPASVTALAQTLTADPEPLVRSHAAWALGCIHNSAASQVLTQALQYENEPTVYQEILAALYNHEA